MAAINVLIVDDNPVTSDYIKKRLEKLNEQFAEESIASIKPFHCAFSVIDPREAGQKVENCIISNSIDLLLLDRGFFDVVDPKNIPDRKLDDSYLFTRRNQKSVEITEILQNVSFGEIKKLKGIIVYAFDDPYQTSEYYVEEAQVKREIKDIVGEKIDTDNIEVLLTNTGIYHLARINIYATAGKEYDEYVSLGSKADFSLYGLFVGKMLYHRIIKTMERNSKKIMRNKQAYAKRNILLLFMMFSALNIGGNAAYNMLIEQTSNNNILFLLSLVFSLAIPFFVLLLRPEWLISIDDE
uniref:Uncharacterized protein n=1 Tax=Candidatus Kentrum sp. UNK TaxID=2126344 RepID=A0A451AZE3_9GAMM|nr:MAG: hypothetical protein BECKUNK1418G_GA0071005_106011 [Candidatus Kentron sp. UNK]VFK71401.1 MAG: hypothetical protein BECKUNK1418H_GA0071006_106411 [Candidatus Kentron sp. UNK]